MGASQIPQFLAEESSFSYQCTDAAAAAAVAADHDYCGNLVMNRLSRSCVGVP